MDKIINFFTTTEGAWGDGSVKLTTIGIVLVAVCILALVVIPAITGKKNSENKNKLTTKQLTYSAVALALAMVCSMIKFANLPMGGSCTLCSMLFIVLIGYWFGPYVGLTAGFAYGLLQFIIEPIFYTLPQMLIDYPLAFGALGLAGFFAGKKRGLQIGYIVGVIGRYIFAVISGVVFFGAYAPEGTPAIVYSLGYNATYIVPEAIVTLIIISIPAVAKALGAVKKNALS